MDISYSYICEKSSQIPGEAIAHIDNVIYENLGKKFGDLFPLFKEKFPQTTKSIEEKWSLPKVALKKGAREWLTFLVAQSQTKNMFFSLQPIFIEKEGELFDEDYRMLPESWKEIYRWFNSFSITDLSYAQMDWWNTPFRYEARLDLTDYEQGSGATKEQTTKFTKAIGCKREDLRCWMLTENKDALFINEAACDGLVYHVNGNEFDKYKKLNDPQGSLDDYLSFYLVGGKPIEFDF
tara:strand:- start:71 stop:781 length:711 start_codon:yes stop_codon:yes gene_type:complete